MSAKRNHYTSTPLMRMDKHPRSVEWEEAPVVLEHETERLRHYRVLQLIMLCLIPIGFIVTLIVGGSTLTWAYVGVSLFFLLLMWLMRAFAQGARSKLTLIYVLAAAVVVVKLVVSTPGSVTQRVVSRVDSSSIFTSDSALDTPTLSDIESAEAEETPSPDATEAPMSEAEARLREFMAYWAAGDTDAMVSMLSPSWVDNSDNPKADLFNITNMIRPTGDPEIKRVDGSSTDTSRPILMIVRIVSSNGSSILKRFQIIMVRSNDVWYVDPGSLNAIGTVTEDDLEPFEQVNNIIKDATPSPAPTPTVNPQLVLYYNTDGGSYYHVDPYCPSVINRKYVPLKGTFLYSELDVDKYRTLKRCKKCNAPEREIPIN